jgi:hypothetical protein
MKKLMLGVLLLALMAPLAGCIVYDGPGGYYGGSYGGGYYAAYPYSYRAYPYYSYRPYYGYYGYRYRGY